MSGFVIRSLYTRAWNIWIEPSSDEDANRGYVGWNATERSARAWYLCAARRVSGFALSAEYVTKGGGRMKWEVAHRAKRGYVRHYPAG